MKNSDIGPSSWECPTFIQNNKHTKILNLLSKIASEVPPVAAARLASAIVIRNDIISIGVNRNKSHPFQKRFGKNDQSIYLHAEINAIRNALREVPLNELKKATLYVARVKKTNLGIFQWGIAKPCEGCMMCADHFEIRNIVYSTDDGGYIC